MVSRRLPIQRTSRWNLTYADDFREEGASITVVAAVMLEDGRVLIASDSAATYADGFRRLEPAGKWWLYPSCVIGISGGGLHLSRVKVKIDGLMRAWKGKGLIEPSHLQEIIHDVQDELKTNDGTESLDLELLYKGAPEGMFLIGGDGDISGPYLDFAITGSGVELTEGILAYALKTRRCRRRSKSAVGAIVLEAMRITADRRDGVSRPLYLDVFSF